MCSSPAFSPATGFAQQLLSLARMHAMHARFLHTYVRCGFLGHVPALIVALALRTNHECASCLLQPDISCAVDTGFLSLYVVVRICGLQFRMAHMLA
jgi:hypothetical protein